ncbi:MAG TPA: ABC transporter substrate-binding protein [Burkholderiaceae bacterium]|jgi:ABC-type branched-subunit amino acid transport system substrate-binding protein
MKILNLLALSATLLSATGNVFAAGPGVTDTEILVGQSAVFSGPTQELGNEMRQGMTAYFNAVNRSGGVDGRTIRLISLDDRYEPDQAAANTSTLINQEKVLALIGYVGTPTTNASLPLIASSGTPLIGAHTGAESLRTPFNRNVFNIRASYMDEGQPIVDQLRQFGSDRIAIFYQNDSFGASVKKSFETALAARGLVPIALATVERNSIDVAKAAVAIVNSGATGVAMGCVYAACSQLMKEVRRLGANPVFVTTSAVGTNALLARIDSSIRGIGISQVMPYPFGHGVGLAREYQAAMKDSGYAKLSYGSMEGYVSARVFVEGLKRAGAHPTRQNLVAAMESLNHFDLGGFSVDFSPNNHNGSRFTEMTVIGSNNTLLR